MKRSVKITLFADNRYNVQFIQLELGTKNIEQKHAELIIERCNLLSVIDEWIYDATINGK